MSSVVEKSSVSKKPTAEKKKVSVKAKQTEEVSTPVVQQAAVAVVEAPKVEAEQVVNSSEESGFYRSGQTSGDPYCRVVTESLREPLRTGADV
jgi:hypothetical protein